jgi:putative hydrolase of the HAD superfamily
MKLPAVFFDLDDTLLDHLGASLRGAGELFDRYPALSTLGRGLFLARWPELTEKHMDRCFQGQVDFATQRRSRMRELFSWVSVELSDAEADEAFGCYLDAYQASFRAFDDVAPCLEMLEAAGVRVGIITNGQITTQRKKLDALDLSARVAPVLITEELGVHKPDPAVFVEAARRAGRPLAECVYVGDKPETDARAAAAAGMHGIWIDRHGTSALDELLRITELTALPALLGF